MVISIEQHAALRPQSPAIHLSSPETILVTGFTEKSCGIGNGPIDFWDATTMVPMLRRHGRCVHLGPYAVGKRLDDIGAVLVIIGTSPVSEHARHALGAIAAMLEAMERRLPLVVLFEDWNLEDIAGGFRDLAERGAEQIARRVDGRYLYADAEAALPHAGRIQDLARQFGDPLSPLWQMAVPAVLKFQAWGDVQRLLRRFVNLPVLTEIDPTPLFLRTLGVVKPVQQRERVWTLAAITSHSHEWSRGQSLGWEIDPFGRAKDGQAVLPNEQAVLDAYAEPWGVLNPPYYHAGSGWYRSRYPLAAAAEAVLLCDPEDAAPLGPTFEIFAPQVEALSDTGLRELAVAQRDAIWPRFVVDERETLRQVDAVFRLATERAQ